MLLVEPVQESHLCPVLLSLKISEGMNSLLNTPSWPSQLARVPGALNMDFFSQVVGQPALLLTLHQGGPGLVPGRRGGERLVIRDQPNVNDLLLVVTTYVWSYFWTCHF